MTPVADLRALHHVALSVRDLDRSLAFYSEVLGFELLFREEADDRAAAVLRFRGGGMSVGLVQFRPAEDAAFDPHRIGLDHLAFDVPDRGELEGWAERLAAADVEHSGIIDIPVGHILNFRDPDGIALAMFVTEPLP